MTNKEAIKYLQQLYPNGGHCWLDEQRMEAIGMAIQALQEEPVSDDLKKAHWNAAIKYDSKIPFGEYLFKAGAEWQKENLWKDAQGDDLPEIDREVIALTQPYQDDDEHLKVVCAHRPSKYAKIWNSDLGEEQVIEVEGYDKGGWNIPDVKFWLDADLPNMEDLRYE